MYQITATGSDPIEERAQLQQWFDFEADDPFPRHDADLDEYFEDTWQERESVFAD